VVIFTFVFKQYGIAFGIFTDEVTGFLVGSGVFITIVIVYFFNKVKK